MDDWAPWLLDDRPVFPPPESARADGLIAIGGDLSIPRLLAAYQQGIFPWYDVAGGPILWWSPDPRLVLEPSGLRISRSLRATIRKGRYSITFDQAFSAVIHACAAARSPAEVGTWIHPEVEIAYKTLHSLGYAHSVEAWDGDVLAGGLYGVLLGGCFFGESMFTRRADASKVALAALVDRLSTLNVHLIDCQVTTGHLLSLGAHEVPRDEFLVRLEAALRSPTSRSPWTGSAGRGET